MKISIGSKVKLHGREYTVSGYAADGEHIYTVWLVGREEPVKGAELKKMEITK